MEECSICNTMSFLSEIPMCKHKICLSCLKACNVCPFCRAKITEPSSRVALGLEKLLKEMPRGQEFLWLYSGRNNGWWFYHFDLQTQIEKAYQKDNNGSINLLICGSNIKLDFHEGVQTNTVTGSQREIIRWNRNALSKLIKGVSGII